MRKISKAIAWSVVIMFMVTMFAPVSSEATTKYGDFPDVGSDHWAKQVVTKMNLREVVVGYDEGNKSIFKPNQAVTKMEAVIMAIRLMDIKEEDASEKTKLAFSVPKWAENAAKSAVEHGMIQENDFKGTEKASREWITRLLIRTVEKDTKDELAKAKDEVLNFTDAKTVSKAFEPYVKLAVKLDLARGNADKTFAPKKAVTRAEMVAFLSRIEDDLENKSPYVLVGEVTKIEGNEITVLAEDKKTYKLTYDAKSNVYDKKGKLIPAADVEVGDYLYAIAKNNQIEYLELKDKKTSDTDKEPEIDKNKRVEVDGKVLSINADDNTIFVEIEDEKLEKKNIEKYIIDTDIVLVNSQDERIKFGDLKVNDKVHLSHSQKGDLLKLERITGQEQVALREGIIKDIVFDDNLILIDEGDSTRIYAFDANTQVKIGTKVDLEMENLKVGDEVKYSATGSRLEAIALVNATFDDLSQGVVESINNKVVTYRTFTGELKSNYLDRNVKVLFNDGVGELGDIKVGDDIEVKLKANRVTEISLTDRALVEKISGTVKVDYGANGIVVIVDRNNENKVYEVDTKTDIRVYNHNDNLYSLKEGMSIEIEVRDRKAIRIRANY